MKSSFVFLLALISSSSVFWLSANFLAFAILILAWAASFSSALKSSGSFYIKAAGLVTSFTFGLSVLLFVASALSTSEANLIWSASSFVL